MLFADPFILWTGGYITMRFYLFNYLFLRISQTYLLFRTFFFYKPLFGLPSFRINSQLIVIYAPNFNLNFSSFFSKLEINGYLRYFPFDCGHQMHEPLRKYILIKWKWLVKMTQAWKPIMRAHPCIVASNIAHRVKNVMYLHLK